jgi:hypothetical protein
VERQESWRCASCGAFTRSWWRTVGLVREAARVVARRKHEALAEERALVRAGMRKRRWKLIALAVVAALAAVGIVTGVHAAEPPAVTGTEAACAHLSRVQSGLAAGGFTSEQLEGELASLQRDGEGADSDVARAFVDFRAAGQPGSSSFLVARTAASDACARAGF